MLLYALGVVIFSFCAAQESTFPICNRNSTDYAICLKNAIQKSWPIFMSGLPQYNFPTLDPFFLDYYRHEYNEVIQANIVVANMSIIGTRKAQLTSVKPHFKKDIFQLKIDIHIPMVLCEGDSEIEGNLIGFKFNGKGHYNVTAEDVRARCFLTGRVANDRWILEHIFINPTVKNMKIYVDDFYKDKEFNEFSMKVVQNNWQLLYQTLQPIASEVWDAWLTDYANRFFSKISFSQLFP